MEYSDELIFFGRMTASVSHEINNVFAIVNELGGLLEDMAYAAGQKKPLDPEKVQQISQSLQKQVYRGKGIVQRLNRFAHSVDDRISEFDVGAMLQDAVDMAQRFAQLKRIDLQAEPPDQPTSLSSNRFFFQQAVVLGIESAFHLVAEGGSVRVAGSSDNGRVEVRIRACDADTSTDLEERTSLLSKATEPVQGDADWSVEDERDRVLRLTFPSL